MMFRGCDSYIKLIKSKGSLLEVHGHLSRLLLIYKIYRILKIPREDKKTSELEIGRRKYLDTDQNELF